ncbi:putative membrane protein [Clostridium bornimense]|uniref:Putative membrane protein n=1 Tax=Clostridium bornimense TaxID=1216932 RepID=W6SIF7_9CLOT|nr:ATP synthase subunit I [Clostridium bornimense]CDM69425.1 putative membrane protein [Clostridium bornimense]
MLKKTLTINTLLLASIYLVTTFFIPSDYQSYTLSGVLGILISSINFTMNYYISYKSTNNFRIVFGFIVRLMMTGITGIILVLKNPYACITFLIGYTIAIVPLILVNQIKLNKGE